MRQLNPEAIKLHVARRFNTLTRQTIIRLSGLVVLFVAMETFVWRLVYDCRNAFALLLMILYGGWSLLLLNKKNVDFQFGLLYQGLGFTILSFICIKDIYIINNILKLANMYFLGVLFSIFVGVVFAIRISTYSILKGDYEKTKNNNSIWVASALAGILGMLFVRLFLANITQYKIIISIYIILIVLNLLFSMCSAIYLFILYLARMHNIR